MGDREALDRLMPLVARELGYLARAFMAGERSDHTLQPTALVHECYLRLVGRDRVNWRDRAHFFAFDGSVSRDWASAIAWLHQAVRSEGAAPAP